MTNKSYSAMQALLDLGYAAETIRELPTTKKEFDKVVKAQHNTLYKELDTSTVEGGKRAQELNGARDKLKNWPEAEHAIKLAQHQQQNANMAGLPFRVHAEQAINAWQEGIRQEESADGLLAVAMAEYIDEVGGMVEGEYVQKKNNGDVTHPLKFRILDLNHVKVDDNKRKGAMNAAAIAAIFGEADALKLKDIHNRARQSMLRMLPVVRKAHFLATHERMPALTFDKDTSAEAMAKAWEKAAKDVHAVRVDNQWFVKREMPAKVTDFLRYENGKLLAAGMMYLEPPKDNSPTDYKNSYPGNAFALLPITRDEGKTVAHLRTNCETTTVVPAVDPKKGYGLGNVKDVRTPAQVGTTGAAGKDTFAVQGNTSNELLLKIADGLNVRLRTLYNGQKGKLPTDDTFLAKMDDLENTLAQLLPAIRRKRDEENALTEKEDEAAKAAAAKGKVA
jgi:hypothetical protein